MAIYFKLPAIPFQDKVSDQGGLFALIWNRWLTALVDRVRSSEWIVASTALTGQGAAIAATAVGPALPAGLYGLRWYARVTTAASSSSSLTVTAGWTDGGVAQSSSGAALVGNTTATSQAFEVSAFRLDAGSTVTFSTAYSTSGAIPMAYSLDVVLFRIGEL